MSRPAASPIAGRNDDTAALLTRLDAWQAARAEQPSQTPEPTSDADRDAARIARSLSMLDAHDRLTSRRRAARGVSPRRRLPGWFWIGAIVAAVAVHHVLVPPQTYRAALSVTLPAGPDRAGNAEALVHHLDAIKNVRSWTSGGSVVTLWADAPSAAAAEKLRTSSLETASGLVASMAGYATDGQDTEALILLTAADAAAEAARVSLSQKLILALAAALLFSRLLGIARRRPA